jgi:hypothetical protein
VYFTLPCFHIIFNLIASPHFEVDIAAGTPYRPRCYDVVEKNAYTAAWRGKGVSAPPTGSD